MFLGPILLYMPLKQNGHQLLILDYLVLISNALVEKVVFSCIFTYLIDKHCTNFLGIFPEPNVDPVIQIANVVRLHGLDENLACVVFTLNTCAPIGHAEVKDKTLFKCNF